jgi:hypothetical protein
VRVALALALVGAAACGGGGGGDDDAPADIDAAAGAPDAAADLPDGGGAAIELEIGSAGEDGTGYIAVAPGGDVSMFTGPQGGHHIWNGYRIRGVTATVQIACDVRRASDDEPITSAPPITREVASEDDWWDSSDAIFTIMCPLGTPVDGVEMIVHMELTRDDDGSSLGDFEKHVVPRCVTEQCQTDCGS